MGDRTDWDLLEKLIHLNFPGILPKKNKSVVSDLDFREFVKSKHTEILLEVLDHQ